MTVEQGGNLSAPEVPAIQTPAAKPRHPIVRGLLFAIREVLGILFWVYVITKLFVFDIDQYLVGTYAPSHLWLLDYRSLFFLGIAGAAFLLGRYIGAVGSLFYILLYPVVLVFWRVPLLLWKQKSWNFTFHLLNGIFGFFKHIRYNMPLVSFYIIALVLVIVSDSLWIIAACNIVLLIFLFMIYGHRIYVIFKPDILLDFYKFMLLKMHEHHAAHLRLDESIRNLPVPQLASTQLQMWRSNLELACLINRIYVVSAKKLRDYQQSGLPILTGIFVSLGMLLMTAVTFAGIDFGIYKLWPEAFTVAGSPGFFAFFLLCFQ